MITIDAANKKLGRVASEAAAALLGKHSAEFVRNRVAAVRVEIVNASKAALGERKRVQKMYTRYSGYPGGLKTLSLDHVIAQKGYREVFKRAVYGMVPKNKLRARIMKNLSVKE